MSKKKHWPQELGKIKAQKELLELKEEDIEENLEAEEEMLEEIEAKPKAEKAIKEAEEEKQKVFDEAEEEGIEVPPNVFDKFDRLLNQAKELFKKEDYQGAIKLVEQAEDALKDIDKEVEKTKKERGK